MIGPFSFGNLANLAIVLSPLGDLILRNRSAATNGFEEGRVYLVCVQIREDRGGGLSAAQYHNSVLQLQGLPTL